MLPDHIGQLKPHQLTRHSLSDEVLAFTNKRTNRCRNTEPHHSQDHQTGRC